MDRGTRTEGGEGTLLLLLLFVVLVLVVVAGAMTRGDAVDKRGEEAFVVPMANEVVIGNKVLGLFVFKVEGIETTVATEVASPCRCVSRCCCCCCCC